MLENTNPSRLGYHINEVIEMSGLSRDSIYRAIREERLAAKKFSRRTLVLHDDLVAFLKALPDLKLESAD